MRSARTRLRPAFVAALLCGNVAAWLTAPACNHDWDTYDPRLGGAADASAEAEPEADAGSDADAAAPPDAGGDGDAGVDAPVDGDGGSGHVTLGLLALYDFEVGSGVTVPDVSGVSPPLDLTIADPAATAWIPGALAIVSPTIVISPGPATKVAEGCMATNEITLDVWFRPTSLEVEGPARLITSSADPSNRNFHLGQELASHYDARLRSTLTTVNGSPSLQTEADGGHVTLRLTHMVFTRDSTGVRRLYLDGVVRATGLLGGDFSTWDETFPLALANEITLDRTWEGELYRVAIYGRALLQPEVAQNHAAGP